MAQKYRNFLKGRANNKLRSDVTPGATPRMGFNCC